MASIIKVDQLSEKTQGSGITLSHSLKNSSGSEIISPSGTVSNLSKLSLTPSSAPSSPVQGDIYLDSSDGELKIYNGTSWIPVDKYTGADLIEYFILGGGGAGGYDNGGGGGAGGLLMGHMRITPGEYDVIVGGGGSPSSSSDPSGRQGGNSRFMHHVAYGGGGGGIQGGNGGWGGCGGGGGIRYPQGNTATGSGGTPGQGYKGGNGEDYPGGSPYRGGGGGGVGDSANGIYPGIGISISWTGTTYNLGGGGGSGGDSSPTSGTFGGGNGASPGGNGTANYGAGGGGGNNGNNLGGLGGDGVVMIRYPGSSAKATGGNQTGTHGGYYYHRFTQSGTLTYIG